MSRRPTLVRALVAGVALAAAACGPVARLSLPSAPVESTLWIVKRNPVAARRAPAAAAPALAAPTGGGIGEGAVLRPSETTIRATLVGPIATVVHTKRYATPTAAVDAVVTFTPASLPARQDHVVRVGNRILSVLVRDPVEAAALAKEEGGARLAGAAADGSVTIALGVLAPSEASRLEVETTAIAPWSEGAYEVLVPRVPEGDASFVADLYGTGPVVIVNSPSHAIDAKPNSLEHLRVTLREPATLRDADFILRYRVDSDDRPGVLVVGPGSGADSIVGVLVHPIERDQEPVAASDVTIDWNGSPVTDVRPAALGRVAAGSPIVVVGRATGPIMGPIRVRAVVGRETRTLVIGRDNSIPAASLAALPVLWARALRAAVTGRR